MARPRPPSSNSSSAIFRPGAAFWSRPVLSRRSNYLEGLRFSAAELDWLKSTGRFRQNLLDYLAEFRFTGDVHAMPEGTVFFANEPILRVTAPLPQAQFVESRLINLLHFQTADRGQSGACRAGGAGQASGRLRLPPRARRRGGADGRARELHRRLRRDRDRACRRRVRHPALRHHGAFFHRGVRRRDGGVCRRSRESRPDNLVFLLDTYDTEAAARKVVALAPRLKANGITIRGVRLNSGDLVALSRSVRAILDAGGLRDVTIFASGGLDEDALAAFVKANAPIDGFGVGTSLDHVGGRSDARLRLQIAGIRRLAAAQASAKKATWPGRKQVWRRYERRTGRDDRRPAWASKATRKKARR